jgi:quaternary ammonium compound-resistance protein SugE
MAWLTLTVAGLLEVAWAIGLKYTQGFTKLWPSVWTILAMIASMWLLAQAGRHLPIGTAYAVWTGIGAVGTAILGMYLFGESRDAVRILCLAMIVGGILGLKFTSSAPEKNSVAHADAPLG